MYGPEIGVRSRYAFGQSVLNNGEIFGKRPFTKHAEPGAWLSVGSVLHIQQRAISNIGSLEWAGPVRVRQFLPGDPLGTSRSVR